MKKSITTILVAVAAVTFIPHCSKGKTNGRLKKIPLTGLVTFGAGDLSGVDLKKGVTISSDRDYNLARRSIADIQLQGVDLQVELRLKEKTSFRLSGAQDDAGTKTADVTMSKGAALFSQGEGKDKLRILTPSLVILGSKGRFAVDVPDSGRTLVTALEGDVKVRRRIPEIENLPPEVVSSSPALRAVLADLDDQALTLRKNETLDFKEARAPRAADNAGVGRIMEAIRKSGVNPAKIASGNLTQADKSKLEAALRDLYSESEQKWNAFQNSIVEYSSTATGTRSQNDAEADRLRAEYDEFVNANKRSQSNSDLLEDAARNKAQEERLAILMDKKVETIVLTSGGTVRGVLYEEGGNYIIYTTRQGKIVVPLSNIDSVQF